MTFRDHFPVFSRLWDCIRGRAFRRIVSRIAAIALAIVIVAAGGVVLVRRTERRAIVDAAVQQICTQTPCRAPADRMYWRLNVEVMNQPFVHERSGFADVNYFAHGTRKTIALGIDSDGQWISVDRLCACSE